MLSKDVVLAVLYKVYLVIGRHNAVQPKGIGFGGRALGTLGGGYYTGK